VGVWTERLDGLSPRAAGEIIRSLGLEISGVNRGGFFTGFLEKQRLDAIDQTKRQIEMTSDLRADTLVIVPGGLSTDLRDIDMARTMVRDGLHEVVEFARTCGVRLAIEPFHPALSSTRGVINTLDLALDLCDGLGDHIGVVTDIFNIWWDPSVYRAIERAGSRIFGHHLCDWKLDTTDLFADRGVMGEGVADVPRLTAAVMRAGYQGWMEIEIFSRNHLWKMDAGAITARCLEHALTCLKKAQQLNAERLQSD
jgi:sugar phosphate isomerase/epimerase